ncbi:hypothetical protein C8F01DRAFT_1355562 [Mycena amicta]|nr:hypothetical protein C8F01DRAFT_1355562 [Mycena amicta]
MPPYAPDRLDTPSDDDFPDLDPNGVPVFDMDKPLSDWSSSDTLSVSNAALPVESPAPPVRVTRSQTQARTLDAGPPSNPVEQLTPSKTPPRKKNLNTGGVVGRTSKAVVDTDPSPVVKLDSTPVDTQTRLSVVDAANIPAPGAGSLSTVEREELEALRALYHSRSSSGMVAIGPAGVSPMAASSIAPVAQVDAPNSALKRKNSDKSSNGDSPRFDREPLAAAVLSDVTKTIFVVTHVPASCEVNPLVSAHIPSKYRAAFESSPPLRIGRFESWSSEPGSYVTYADVLRSSGHLHVSIVLTASFYTVHKEFFNPARASPTAVIAVSPVSGGKPRRSLYVGDAVGYATTPIKVTHSHISAESAIRSATGSTTPQRSIGGLVFRGEFERMVSFVCMATDRSALSAQMRANTLSFQTLPQGWATANSPAKRRRDSNPFTSSARSAPSAVRIDHALGFEEKVPIYDCRSQAATATFADCLDRLDTLPLYVGQELAVGSIAVVAYHINQYEKAAKPDTNPSAVSLYIKWVMLVGDPKM